MSKNKMTMMGMILLTVLAFGGVLFAYGREAPSLAVGISFVSLIMNYSLGQRAGLISI